jgi:hypothetical protein
MSAGHGEGVKGCVFVGREVVNEVYIAMFFVSVGRVMQVLENKYCG